jgi:hypothetical protein
MIICKRVLEENFGIGANFLLNARARQPEISLITYFPDTQHGCMGWKASNLAFRDILISSSMEDVLFFSFKVMVFLELHGNSFVQLFLFFIPCVVISWIVVLEMIRS